MRALLFDLDGVLTDPATIHAAAWKRTFDGYLRERAGRALAQAAQHQPARALQPRVGRRTDVVGIFPDDRSLVRLAGMLCIEQNDEWLVGRGYLSAESISLVIAGRDDHPTNEIREEVPGLQPA